MPSLQFDNYFLRELPGNTEINQDTRHAENVMWSAVTPTSVANPQLIAYSTEVAAMLGLSATDMQDPQWIATLAGNSKISGMSHYATRYGGHQFGHWAGQLGDGRAIFLGEAIYDGKRYEMQLKGAGKTPYSRHADGRAVLRSSLREFLCSEAMHHLGIPSTRALSLIDTGEQVTRDMFYNGNPERESGAIVCRVAPSFTRFGHFEILAAKNELSLLKRMIGFTIARDFAEWLTQIDLVLVIENPSFDLIEAWFSEICKRTAIMMAGWMRVGFVHGVMNTDNMSILGLTIDYGPYGWVDNFDPGWTPNTTDAQGRRYCFGRQPEIARWNLERLADALAKLLPNTQGLSNGIHHFDYIYNTQLTHDLAGKFGFTEWRDEDAELINRCFELMTRAEVDMTLFFTHLATVDLKNPIVDTLQHAFYSEQSYQQFAQDFQIWLNIYAQRCSPDTCNTTNRITSMRQFNPRYVLRNYIAQEAIDLATQGDNSRLITLLALLRQPYTQQAGMEVFEQKRPDWAKHKAGCSMLSCSS